MGVSSQWVRDPPSQLSSPGWGQPSACVRSCFAAAQRQGLLLSWHFPRSVTARQRHLLCPTTPAQAETAWAGCRAEHLGHLLAKWPQRTSSSSPQARLQPPNLDFIGAARGCTLEFAKHQHGCLVQVEPGSLEDPIGLGAVGTPRALVLHSPITVTWAHTLQLCLVLRIKLQALIQPPKAIHIGAPASLSQHLILSSFTSSNAFISSSWSCSTAP